MVHVSPIRSHNLHAHQKYDQKNDLSNEQLEQSLYTNLCQFYFTDIFLSLRNRIGEIAL